MTMECRGNLALGQSLNGAAAGMVGQYSSSTLEVAQISESSQSTTYLPRVCVCWGLGGGGALDALQCGSTKRRQQRLRVVMGYEGQRVLVPKATIRAE